MSEKPAENACCNSEDHRNHLCSLLCRDMDQLDKEGFEKLTNDPLYRCQVCSRTAHSPENLCDPLKM